MNKINPSVKNKICFVIAYFGELPIWLPAFLCSCEKNPTIDWLIWTDSDYTAINHPSNVRFLSLSLPSFLGKAAKTMEALIHLETPHKLCDMKPIYGDIFKEELASYMYWGHCDLDLIWGDIESFLEEINYDQYDIISSRRATICGHFTLYRNIEKLNKFYRQVPNYKKAFLIPHYSGFDEGFFSYTLYEKSLEATFPYKIFWPRKYAVDWPELDIKPYGWRWEEGKILDKNGKERIYLHFMKWKKTLNKIDFAYEDAPDIFFIRRNGICSKKMLLGDTLQYLLPTHLGRLIKYYWYKIESFIKRVILKKPKPESAKGPIIPKVYRKL